MDPSLVTLHNIYGHIHPSTRLFEAPLRWDPCVLRWTDSTGEVTDYLITSLDDLHRMALWILDAMAGNLHVPPTLDYYHIPPEHASGRYSPLDHQDVIDEVDYERFQAIRRARHAAMAWWWLQRNLHTAEGGTWKFEFIPLENSRNSLPVPTDPPPTPIVWLTPP